MSDLLSIGASGIKAYSRALATISDNIANSQTPGYARRSIQLEEARASGDLVLYRNTLRPGGVAIGGVVRAVDEWLIADARIASGDASRNTARLAWMDITERALDNGGNGVGKNMTAIFAAADKLTANPNDTTLRAEFLQAVESTAGAFQRTAKGLESAASGIAASAQTTVNQTNTDLAALQRVNDGLLRSREGSTNAATLLDERDRLVDQISSSIGVIASFDAHGVTTLRAAGPGGETLLDGPVIATLSLTAAADGRIGFGITASAGGTLTPVNGTLAGLVDAANVVANRRTDLDALASTFSNDMNARHQAGLDANGNAGVALFNLGTGAVTLTAAALAPDQLAVGDATSVNGNMLAFAGLRGPTGSEADWTALASMHAQATAAARAQDAASTVRREGAFAARNDVSEIDLDREAADLLRFQQAYEAAARTIQVARETMQTIFNIF